MCECFLGLFGLSATKARKDELRRAKGLVTQLIQSKSCGPILLRTAWHDAGTYDKNKEGKTWPNAGGAIGSIRTDHEINAPPNAGLAKAVTSYLEPIKDQVPGVTWADLIQMGGAVAVEEMGGPKIDMIYGRWDGIPTELPKVPFGLPGAMPPFDQPGVKDEQSSAEHLRYVFYKYNMDDKDIVALSGSHTVGRAYADRSGAVKEAGGGSDGTAYTRRGAPGLENSLTAGGRSWTKDWLTFDNSYFTAMKRTGNDPEVVYFPTDLVLMDDPGFKPHFDKFAASQAAFFEAYAAAHKRLSEQGSRFEPSEGLRGI